MEVDSTESAFDEAVSVWGPVVFRVIAKTPVPFTRLTGVGRIALPSLEATVTVPVNPVAVF